MCSFTDTGDQHTITSGDVLRKQGHAQIGFKGSSTYLLTMPLSLSVTQCLAPVGMGL